jgi:hypothetical protein
MFLVLFAAVGFSVGFWLQMTRSGYLAMSLTAVAFLGGEIVHVLTTTNRASLTLLPLVIGLLLTTFMLAGALVRLVVGSLQAKPNLLPPAPVLTIPREVRIAAACPKLDLPSSMARTEKNIGRVSISRFRVSALESALCLRRFRADDFFPRPMR